MHPFKASIFQELDAPFYFKIYLLIVGVILLFSAVYFPITDSDALGSYVARFEYQRFGELKNIATLSIQYLFPKTFDWILWQFGHNGYLAGVPTLFCLCLILGSCVILLNRSERFWAIALLCSSPLILTQSVSQKNDIALAAFALTGVVALLRCTTITGILISSLMASLCIGTKWSGICIPVIFVCVQLVMIVKRRLIREAITAYSLVFLMAPLLFFIASGSSYLENFMHYGTPTPILADVRSVANVPTLKLNLAVLLGQFYTNTLDVLHVWIELFSKLSHLDLHALLNFHHYFYIFSGLYTSHAPIGLPLLVIVVLTVCVFFTPLSQDFEIRILALSGMLYLIAVLFFLPIAGGQIRYILSTIILWLPIAARLLHRWVKQPAVKHVSCLIALWISTSVIMLNNDRTFPQPIFATKDSWIHYAHDHDLLMFLGLPGYIAFFEKFKQEVPLYKSLALIDNATQADIDAAEIPTFMPFLVKRSPANTGIWRTRYHDISKKYSDFDYLLVYTRRGVPMVFPGYRAILDTGWPALILYRRN